MSRLLRPTRCILQYTDKRALSTANESEIAHFSRLSAHWWDEQGEFKPLHHMNPIRVKFIRDKILESQHLSRASSSRVLDGMDVIDVGCGGGLLSESLARMGARTLGIDAAESNIQIASLHAARDPVFKSQTLKYLHTTAETLLVDDPATAEKFDVVCSLEVLEHVDRPSEFLHSLARLTKPGGHLFLSTIARTPLSYFLTILMAENVLRVVTPGTHSHSKFINPSELFEFFRDDLRWISRLYDGQPTRTEAEVRGLAYWPWSGTWTMLPRGIPGTLECNYILWARKPLLT